jgi:hypothetical protein
MPTVADLTNWLQAQTWWPTDPIASDPTRLLSVYGPDELDIVGLNDRCVFLFPTAGAGFLLEQALDVPGFQFRIRGKQREFSDAESLARTIDVNLVKAWPTTIAGLPVPRISRVGGAPAYLTRDPAGRTHFTGNYLFTTAAG